MRQNLIQIIKESGLEDSWQALWNVDRVSSLAATCGLIQNCTSTYDSLCMGVQPNLNNFAWRENKRPAIAQKLMAWISTLKLA